MRALRRVAVLGMVLLAVAGGATAAALGIRTSPPRVPFPAAAPADYQIGGAYPPAAGVRIVDRDQGAAPVRGLYNICYVNAYQAQTGQVGWWERRHPGLLLRDRAGEPIVDTGWDEPLLDTSTPAKRAALADIVGGWIAGCARHGFQAVEPDNLDSFQRSHGRLSLADNLAFAGLLARRAHAVGLDIAQKNLAEDSARVHALGYDFAISEQCEQYSECGSYTSVYGHRLIDIEYQRSSFLAACRRDAGRFSIELRDLEVLPRGAGGYLDAHC